MLTTRSNSFRQKHASTGRVIAPFSSTLAKKENILNLQDEIMETITNAMPDEAVIKVVEKIGDFHVGISWKLNDDPERPNKMSKTILIIVSHEAVEDYSSAIVIRPGKGIRKA